jgi:endoglucanase
MTRRLRMGQASTIAGLLLIMSSAGWLLAASPPASPPAAGKPAYYGVNLASAEFAPEKIPGVYAKDYIYPSRQTGAPFLAAGMNSVRLPILWERIQPHALGPLDAAELARLDRSLAELDGFAMVILDPHNSARYRGQVLTKAPGSIELMPDLWRRLAEHYKGQPKIAFGLMNEPHDMDGKEWRAILDRTVLAIRATGAGNLLLVPGIRWTGGHSWFEGGDKSNAALLSGFTDPANNFLFEIHQYLDANSSGTSRQCAGRTIGRDRLVMLTQWLRREKAGAVLAEFGASSSAECLASLDDLLDFLDTHADVWRGWNYWAAGDWWGDYSYGIQPDGATDKPQMAVLRRHLARYGQAH